MNILITAPSLNSTLNVSGISSIVNLIIENNIKHKYFHYLLGKPDEKLSKRNRFNQLLKQFFLFPLAVKSLKIDLVHQNLPFDPKGLIRESIISFLCRRLNVPVVLHIHGGKFITHGTNNFLYFNLAKSLFVNSKQVVVLSEIENIMLKEKFNFKNANILANSIDTSIYRNHKRIFNIEKPTVLYLGRIDENKGLNEIINAFKILVAEYSFKFVLCGDGPLKDFTVAAFEKILGSDFEYKGVVMGEQKIDIIQNADFFILPSYFEGMPMSLLETMAAGVVPIVSKVGSMKDIVIHEGNGLLVEKMNYNDLYEKLKISFSNQELYFKLSENAKRTILENYGIENYIIKLNQVYEEAYSNNKK